MISHQVLIELVCGDSRGMLLKAIALHLLSDSSLMIEAMAVRESLKVTKIRQLHVVEIESDSKLVYEDKAIHIGVL